MPCFHARDRRANRSCAFRPVPILDVGASWLYVAHPVGAQNLLHSLIIVLPLRASDGRGLSLVMRPHQIVEYRSARDDCGVDEDACDREVEEVWEDP